jgi:predicted XRE-type DNA-binding protein
MGARAGKERRHVFRDIGMKNPEQELLKAKLTRGIYKNLKSRGLTQEEAAKRLGTTQAKVSALMRCKPVSLSVGKLIKFLTPLGKDVQAMVKPAPRRHKAGNISVVIQDAPSVSGLFLEKPLSVFTPHLTILPPPQRRLWPELAAVPESFTLYGGTALALRLAHRTSVDFDFFSNQPFDPEQLARSIPFLNEAERVQMEANTLTCRVERGGPVLVSFFGALGLGQAASRERVDSMVLHVASLLDLAGTKAAVVQKRADAKDYLDIDAILRHGIDLPTALAAGLVLYGKTFNPFIALKALTYFEDVAGLPGDVRCRLVAAAAAVNPLALPVLTPYAARPAGEGGTA